MDRSYETGFSSAWDGYKLADIIGHGYWDDAELIAGYKEAKLEEAQLEIFG